MNFIVAEASNSYNEVSEYLEEFIQKQKADLTQEAEDVYPEQLKEEKKFPKYIIIRQIDDWNGLTSKTWLKMPSIRIEMA